MYDNTRCLIKCENCIHKYVCRAWCNRQHIPPQEPMLEACRRSYTHFTHVSSMKLVRRAEWKEITTHNGCTPDYDCVCSECEESGHPSYKYCPHCGARMEVLTDAID